MKYFKALLKFGHVGRNKYLLKRYYLKAETKKIAAQIAKRTPRVKHNDKEFLQALIEIDFDEYSRGMDEYKKDLYFHVHSIQDSKRNNCVDYNELKYEEKHEKHKKTHRHSYLVNQERLKEAY